MTTHTQQESSKPGEKPVRKGTSDRDQLLDQLRSMEGVGDDFAVFIANNWKKLLGAVVVVMLLVWLVNKFQEGQLEKQAEAAGYFANVQRAYSSLATEKSIGTGTEQDSVLDSTAEGDQEKAEAVFDSEVKVLQSSYSGSVYGQLATLYKARALLFKGDYSAARQALSEFSVDRFAVGGETVGVSQEGSGVLLEELAALLFAKAQIAVAETRVDGRALLVGLTRGGNFLNLEALITLYRISATESEKRETIEVAKKLIAERPGLTEAASREFRKLGVQLP